MELGSDLINHGEVICTYDEERGTTIEASLSYLELHSFTRFLRKSLTARKSKRSVDTLGHGNEQSLHVLRVLNKVVLRHDINQGTNRKVSSVLGREMHFHKCKEWSYVFFRCIWTREPLARL